MALSVEQLTMYQEFYKDGIITKEELRRVILGLPEPVPATAAVEQQATTPIQAVAKQQGAPIVQQAAAEPLQSVAPIVQTTTPKQSKKARKRAAQKAKKQATTKANKSKKQAAKVVELPAAVPVVAQPITKPITKQSQSQQVPVPTEAVAPIGFVEVRNVKGSNKQRLRDYKLDAPNSPYAASIGDPIAFGEAINSEAVTLIRDTMKHSRPESRFTLVFQPK